MHNIKKYTHKEFNLDLDILVSKLKDHTEKVLGFDCVIGVARGGLVPAVYISHALGLPLRIVEYSSRDGMVSDASSLEWLKTVSSGIIVDDLADSGHTLNFLQSINPDLLTAVLVQKEMSDHTADFYGSRTTSDDWLEFPWEAKDRYSA